MISECYTPLRLPHGLNLIPDGLRLVARLQQGGEGLVRDDSALAKETLVDSDGGAEVEA